MTDNYDHALDYSNRWLEIIRQDGFPEEEQAKWIIEELKHNFAEHFNRGWLEYRKSVTEAVNGRPPNGRETVRLLKMCWAANISIFWAALA